MMIHGIGLDHLLLELPRPCQVPLRLQRLRQVVHRHQRVGVAAQQPPAGLQHLLLELTRPRIVTPLEVVSCDPQTNVCFLDGRHSGEEDVPGVNHPS